MPAHTATLLLLLQALLLTGCSNAYRNTFVAHQEVSRAEVSPADVTVVRLENQSIDSVHLADYPDAQVLGRSTFQAENPPIGSVQDAAARVGADTVLTQRVLIETKRVTKRVRIPHTYRKRNPDGSTTPVTRYRSVLRPATVHVYEYRSLFLRATSEE